MRRKIKISFRNGITFSYGVKSILSVVEDRYEFENSSDPDFIIFGPYGNDIPGPGNYCRIGYFCENITPDLSICEWAFGIPREEEIMNHRYRRIQWHDLDPQVLIKNLDDNDIDQLVSRKRKFCNFTYSNPVPYREEFFRQLSKYKKVDAPGKSMNNMPSFDTMYEGTVWERKRKFLSDYTFTIAFESYVYPGYQTEKLYDAMQQNSIPIYCGDPYIGEIFNTKSFINVLDYIRPKNTGITGWLARVSQQNFIDYRPAHYTTVYQRLRRKVKAIGRSVKMNLQLNKFDFSETIHRIVEIDRDPDLYRKYLQQPWFHNNTPPAQASSRDRWIEIFES